MLILLSPTKTMDESSDGLDTYPQSEPQMKEHTEELLAIMKKKSKNELKKLMKLSDNLASLNAGRYKNFEKGVHKQSALLFKGPAFAYLDTQSLTKPQQDYLQKHLRILSGLYGVLRPFDLMHPYRLEMGTKLETKRGKNLYKFWGSHISEILKSELKDGDFIINSASNEYFNAVDLTTLREAGIRIISVVFKEKKDGRAKAISIYAKQARGLFARWCATSNVSSIDDLKKFNVSGYKYQAKESKEDSFCFIRPQPATGKRKNTSKETKGKKRKRG